MLELDALTLRRRRKRLVDQLTLSCPGGVVGLLGPNGAGKTTLMRVLATELRPSSGSVRIDGVDLRDRQGRRAYRRELGYLPQGLQAYPGFTVHEFVAYLAWARCVPGDEIDARARDAIEQVGLAGDAATKVRHLSGGMRQRMGIAQAIVNRPRVLLLDEPTAGLDPARRVSFRRMLRDVATHAELVVLSTHLVEDVARTCERVWVMDHGEVRFDGTPDELASPAGANAEVSPLEAGYHGVLGVDGVAA